MKELDAYRDLTVGDRVRCAAHRRSDPEIVGTLVRITEMKTARSVGYWAHIESEGTTYTTAVGLVRRVA